MTSSPPKSSVDQAPIFRGRYSGVGSTRPKRSTTPAALAAAAREGDRLAATLLAEAGAAVGVAAANLINALDPDLIVLAGGVSRAGRFILEPARLQARRRIMNPDVQKCRFRLRALGDDGAALGAALLARESSA